MSSNLLKMLNKSGRFNSGTIENSIKKLNSLRGIPENLAPLGVPLENPLQYQNAQTGESRNGVYANANNVTLPGGDVITIPTDEKVRKTTSYPEALISDSKFHLNNIRETFFAYDNNITAKSSSTSMYFEFSSRIVNADIIDMEESFIWVEFQYLAGTTVIVNPEPRNGSFYEQISSLSMPIGQDTTSVDWDCTQLNNEWGTNYIWGLGERTIPLPQIWRNHPNLAAYAGIALLGSGGFYNNILSTTQDPVYYHLIHPDSFNIAPATQVAAYRIPLSTLCPVNIRFMPSNMLTDLTLNLFPQSNIVRINKLESLRGGVILPTDMIFHPTIPSFMVLQCYRIGNEEKQKIRQQLENGLPCMQWCAT